MTRENMDGGMPSGGVYDLIMCDPPWRFKTRSAKGITAKGAGGQYQTMTFDDLAALEIPAAENCLLWLWATNPMLPQAFELLSLWGFTFKTAGHWAKMTRHNKQAFGTGYIFRCAGEPYLIGTKGKIKTTRSVRSVVIGKVREHSRKPDEAYDAAERLIPDARRLDMFARERREGWASWGDQVDHFPVATTQKPL